MACYILLGLGYLISDEKTDLSVALAILKIWQHELLYLF